MPLNCHPVAIRAWPFLLRLLARVEQPAEARSLPLPSRRSSPNAYLPATSRSEVNSPRFAALLSQRRSARSLDDEALDFQQWLAAQRVVGRRSREGVTS